MIRSSSVRKESARRQCFLQYASECVRWCSCAIILIVYYIPVTSTASAFLFDHTIRLPINQQGLSFPLYFVPNNSIRKLRETSVLSFMRPTAYSRQGNKRITMKVATINSLPQQVQPNPVAVLSQRSDNSNSTGVNSFLTKNRTIAERTWHLLNIEIGSWDHADFEVMESIVESLCSTSSHTQQQPHQKQRLRLEQQQHYKRAAVIIERFLYRIIQEQRMENPYADCVDMTALYTNLIYSWSNSNEIGSPERAEEILDYFQTIYEEGDSYDPLLCGPTIDSFNAVIGAYAQSGRTDAPQQSIRVLTKLYELNKAGRTLASPNQQSFTYVLRAWAKMATAESPELVRRTLAHMDTLASTYPTVKPDYNCHNEYFCALTESVNGRKISEIEAANMAEQYLYKLLESDDESVLPDKWSFTMVLTLISRSNSPDSISRAEALVARLEQYHERCGRTEKTQPNTNTYNALMSCYTRHGNKRAKRARKLLHKMKKISTEYNPAALPSTVSYNIVMNAFAKSPQNDAPLHVEALLHEMYEDYNTTGDVRVRPNLRSLNICLDAWAKSSMDGADERILEWIYKVRSGTMYSYAKIIPDSWSYIYYLQALARSGRARMADEAERILNEVENLYQTGYQGLKPNVLTFTSVIHCIALSGQDDSVERALAILDRMEDLHAEGFGDVRPNLFTYNCVINTIAKSKRHNKAEVAMQILRRMQSVALRPGCVSFNNVINACAFSNHPDDDPEKVLQIALDVLKEAQDGPGANWITYQDTIRVICSFVSDPERRWHLTREIFRQCCNDGQLTRTILTQIRFGVTEAQYAMLEDEVMATSHIPSLSLSSNYTSNSTSTGRQILDKFTVNARQSFLDGSTRVVRL